MVDEALNHGPESIFASGCATTEGHGIVITFQTMVLMPDERKKQMYIPGARRFLPLAFVMPF
jgi:hypothetical protein